MTADTQAPCRLNIDVRSAMKNNIFSNRFYPLHLVFKKIVSNLFACKRKTKILSFSFNLQSGEKVIYLFIEIETSVVLRNIE